MRLRMITAPAVQPVSIEQARDHVEAYGTDHDTKLAGMIAAAVGHLDGAAGVLGRALIEQKWELTLDGFPAGALCLPLPPLLAVTALTYVDIEGAVQTLPAPSYKVEPGENGRVSPAYGTTWPKTRAELGAVRVEFLAGYGATPQSVPGAIVAAILLIVGDLFENREGKIVGTIASENSTVDMLLFPYKAVRP